MNYEYWRHYLRGWIFHFLGRGDTAYAAYETAFRHNPQAAPPARALGFIAAQGKRYPEAERWFREVVRIVPQDADTWFNLGYVLGEANRSEDAIAAFRQAVALRPNIDRAWYGMGLCLARCGAHAEAARAFEEATSLQPMNSVAWYQLGMAYFHQHQQEEVEKVIRRVLQFDPKVCHQLIIDAERSDLEELIKGRIL